MFKIADKHIGQLAEMEVEQLNNWINSIEEHLTDQQKTIGRDIITEIKKRLTFLLNVGLNYISLNLPAATLSGGEAQRIRLATQIGSELTGVLYI